MKLYLFNNFYISGKQTGIQAGHAADVLQYKYVSKPFEQLLLHMEGEKSVPLSHRDIQLARQVIEWQKNHRTYIILNGGDNVNLAKIRSHIESAKNPYPHAAFKEEGIGNQLTSIAILLPAYMYDSSFENFTAGIINVKDEFGNNVLNDFGWPLQIPYTGHNFTEWESEFLKLKNKCPLAS